MKHYFWLMGMLSLFPAAALWLSWPRRNWAAWACAGGGFVVGIGGLLAADSAYRLPWLAAVPCSMAACLYAVYLAARNARDHQILEENLAKRLVVHAKGQEALDEAKIRSRDIEIEQREVTALYGMVKAVSESLTWADIRPKIEMAVQQYLRLEEFSIFVVEDGAENDLRVLIRKKLAGSMGGSWDTLQRYLQEHQLSVTVPHGIESPEKAVAVPIFESEKLVGYFYARLPADADPEGALSKAQTFVEEISFAFRRVKLFHEVERHSRVDGLTGVYRRGVLDEKLQEEVVRAEAFKTTFCLMILDIDHFKSLNDKYGHQFGDHVLQRIGGILKESVYETDFVARYGGEEFAILLPRADSVGVLRKAESVRRAVAEASFELAMQSVRVTISIGVAHFPRDGRTADALVQQADQALYMAKESGRNKTVDIIEARKPK